MFNPSDFLEQYQRLSIPVLTEQVTKVLEHTTKNSEDSVTSLLGTIELSDGRQARVELKIDAEYIVQETYSNNLDFFETN